MTNYPKVDSPEGIAIMFAVARHAGLVLNESHERLAIKHGVSTDGVIISRPIPIPRN